MTFYTHFLRIHIRYVERAMDMAMAYGWWFVNVCIIYTNEYTLYDSLYLLFLISSYFIYLFVILLTFISWIYCPSAVQWQYESSRCTLKDRSWYLNNEQKKSFAFFSLFFFYFLRTFGEWMVWISVRSHCHTTQNSTTHWI